MDNKQPSTKFKNKDVFGNTFDAYKMKANGHILSMILNNKIDKSGFVKDGNLSELWSYIYVLFLANRHNIELFKQMHGVRGRLKERATAKRFIKSVLDYTESEQISTSVLINFINTVIKKEEPYNPVLPLLGTPIKTPHRSPIHTLPRPIDNDQHDKLLKEITDLTTTNKQITKTLNHVKNTLKKTIGDDTNDDIDNVLIALKDHIKQLKSMADEQKAKDENSAKAAKSAYESCMKELDKLITVNVYSKMCLLKYIGNIISSKSPIAKCSTVDISKQKSNFSKLSTELQSFYKNKYEAFKDSLQKYQETLPQMTECSDNIIAKITEELEQITHELTNMYEDLYGSVRVFVRIRPFIEAIDNLDDANNISFQIKEHTTISMKCGDNIMFRDTEFFGVFDDKFSNLDIYTGKANSQFEMKDLEVKLKGEVTDIPHFALMKTFKQLENGYSIIFNGYGLSGSGKTSIFLGHGKEFGLLHYGLRNCIGMKKLELHQAFELYYHFVSPNDLTLNNKIILLYDSTGNFTNSINKYGADKSDIVSEELKFNTTSVQNSFEITEFIKNITDTCQKHMKSQGRIKQTPLNNQSSRSHLSLIFKMTFDTGVIGYVTLNDLAGFENAYSIYQRIFTKTSSLPFFLRQFDSLGRFKGDMKKPIEYFLNVDHFNVTNGTEVLIKGSQGNLQFKTERSRIESTLAKNVQIIYESFAIVESLLHLKYFFNKRNGVNRTFAPQKIQRGDLQYDINKVFKSPQLEDVFSNQYDRNKASKVRCLMLPILNYLDNFTNADKHKITKWVMFAALRGDKCIENKESLEFAASISSTKVKSD